MDTLYNKKEVAELLKVSVVTVDRMVRFNKIEHIKLGGKRGAVRISESALNDYIKNSVVKKKPNEGELR